jgi:hypothetical protein
MVCTTFLVTTPEAWVPALGDTTHGFPYLSGAGRLIIKDVIMLGAAVVTMADSAKASVTRPYGQRRVRCGVARHPPTTAKIRAHDFPGALAKRIVGLSLTEIQTHYFMGILLFCCARDACCSPLGFYSHCW